MTEDNLSVGLFSLIRIVTYHLIALREREREGGEVEKQEANYVFLK